MDWKKPEAIAAEMMIKTERRSLPVLNRGEVARDAVSRGAVSLFMAGLRCHICFAVNLMNISFCRQGHIL